MRLISWNIDSLNAALTSDSPRAQLSRDVLADIARADADVIALQETKLPAEGPSAKHIEKLQACFPNYAVEWVSSVPPAKKGYAVSSCQFLQDVINIMPQNTSASSIIPGCDN